MPLGRWTVSYPRFDLRHCDMRTMTRHGKSGGICAFGCCDVGAGWEAGFCDASGVPPGYVLRNGET